MFFLPYFLLMSPPTSQNEIHETSVIFLSIYLSLIAKLQRPYDAGSVNPSSPPPPTIVINFTHLYWRSWYCGYRTCLIMKTLRVQISAIDL